MPSTEPVDRWRSAEYFDGYALNGCGHTLTTVNPISPPPKRTMVWQSLAFMTACHGLLIAALALLWTLLPAHGQCGGIDCIPHDLLLRLAIMFGPLFLAAALLASAVMLWFTVARNEPQAAWAIGTTAALTGWLVGFAAILLQQLLQVS
ncbi:hypothetical protein V6U81_22065 [Micromonospora sp. CPCC 205711]|uniref:hypothetical protein n=1 Tax=Micromonospora sp. CPCC 205547 TaxID=3122400 RepID=UPI002FF12EA1